MPRAVTSAFKSVRNASLVLIIKLGCFKELLCGRGARTNDPSTAHFFPVATKSTRLTLQSPIFASNGSTTGSIISVPASSISSFSSWVKYGVSNSRTPYAVWPTVSSTVSPSTGMCAKGDDPLFSPPPPEDDDVRRASASIRAFDLGPPIITKCRGWSARTDCRAARASTRPSRGVYTTSARTSRRRGTTETLTGGLPLRPLMIPFPLDRSATSSIFSLMPSSPPSPSWIALSPSSPGRDPPESTTGLPSLPNPRPRRMTSSPILPDFPANLEGSTPVTMSTKLSTFTAIP
mmetsp:Transcript_5352/g.8426  ORF Transcript_5352/g.8426 Transcript_5352/m.8426 type:complete len:291 (-) Transcript_5352:65-937(-)